MLITINDFKTYNQITDSTNDTLISMVISASWNYCEGYCNRKFESQTHTYYMKADTYEDCVFLDNTPITSLTAIEEFNGAQYIPFVTGSVSPQINKQMIILYDNYLMKGLEYKITYVGGYTAQTFPIDLKVVMLEIATMMYNQSAPAGIARLGINNISIGSGASEGQSFTSFADMNLSWKFILDNYRVIKLTGGY